MILLTYLLLTMMFLPAVALTYGVISDALMFGKTLQWGRVVMFFFAALFVGPIFIISACAPVGDDRHATNMDARQSSITRFMEWAGEEVDTTNDTDGSRDT